MAKKTKETAGNLKKCRECGKPLRLVGLVRQSKLDDGRVRETYSVRCTGAGRHSYLVELTVGAKKPKAES